MSEQKYQFDPNRAINLLLELIATPSLEELLEKMLKSIMAPPAIVCAQIWLLEKGDICSVCPYKDKCQDRSQCLHLHLGTTKLKNLPLKIRNAIFHSDNRIPIGVGINGQLCSNSHGESEHLFNWKMNPQKIEGCEWIKETEIQSIVATSIVYQEKVIGCVTVYTKDKLPPEGKPWSKIYANHLGAAITTSKALSEIQKLKSQLELQNNYLKEAVFESKSFGGLVGKSVALQRIVSQIDLVAPTDASVLILGETGTGKELVAYEIHKRSPRKSEPLIAVNCASIPKDLFESEFFGHIKGAFTGAVKDRAGFFEMAERGTLFLDEVGEIPLDMQSKLLRVLQEKCYMRVGDDHTRIADVRIIAATNQKLKKAVEAGTFREDLYYRINVFPIEIPPLRERKEDIPLLTQHFVKLSVKELRCQTPFLTQTAINTLMNYNWPGNIRELRNIVERAIILSRGKTLHFNLPEEHLHHSNNSNNLLSSSKKRTYLTEMEMLQFEKENLLSILNAAHWKIKGPGGAADLLGINPTTLISRMKKMGLHRPKTD